MLHLLCRRLPIAVVLYLAAPRLMAQQSAVRTTAVDAGEATMTGKPCHELLQDVAYMYPGRYLLGHRAPPQGSIVWGVAMDTPLPIGSQSIELQSYAPGSKLIIKPVSYNRGKDASVVDFWRVYRVEKRAELLRVYDAYGVDIDNTLLVGTPAQRALRAKARKMEDHLFGSWDSDGLQTPYVETKWHRSSFLNDIIRGGSEGYYTDTYVYEACTPVSLVTPAQVQQTYAPALVQRGYTYCAKGDPALTLNPPDCLGTYLLGAAEDDTAWQQFVNYRMFIPLVGTTYKVKDCLDTTEPGCWGDAVVSGITDAATILVPFSKAATASKLARVNAVGKSLKPLARPLLGMAGLGQAGLGFVAWSDNKKGEALARIAGAGLLWFEMAHTNNKGRLVETLRQVDDVDVDGVLRQVDQPTPQVAETCATPDPLEPVPKTCDLDPMAAGSCRICPVVDDLIVYTAKKALLTDVEMAAFLENLNVLGPPTSMIRTNPAAARSAFEALGVPVAAQPGEALRRQWGDLTFIVLEKPVSIPSSQFKAWAQEAQQASGAVSGAAFEEALQDKVSEGLRNYFSVDYYGYDFTSKKAVVSRCQVVLDNGQVYPVGTGSLPGENIVDTVVAQAYAEELLHGSGLGRVYGHGFDIPNVQTKIPGLAYLAHTRDLYDFMCWLEGLSDNEYMEILVPGSSKYNPPIPTATVQTYRVRTFSDVMEADIAIWLRDHGVKFYKGNMPGSYDIREFLKKWYKERRNVEY